jgi:YjbE family integral membrane protein
MFDWIVPLAQVLFIDLVLAGDNAIVVGMAAAGLPTDQRRKAIFWGIIAATIMRIAFAAITTQLLAIVGITLAGGVLLLWVCWKMFRELQEGGHDAHDAEDPASGAPGGAMPRKTMTQAITQILVADISMSLDNVLAVAGAAKDHLWVLVVGLAISVVLMGVAANFIAGLLNKHRWIAWVGLLVILYVAIEMIWSGTNQVASDVPYAYSYLMLPLGYMALPDVFPPWIWALATLAQVIVLVAVGATTARLVRRVGRRSRHHGGSHEPAATADQRTGAAALQGTVPTP